MCNRHVLAALIAALALCVPSVSRAAMGRHDGLYLELTLGLGPQASYARDDAEPGASASVHRSAVGVGATASLLIGGSPLPGFVLGGGALGSFSVLGAWTSTQEGKPPTVDDGDDPFTSLLGLVGPFCDYYPNPARGFHVQALPGYAMFAMSNDGQSHASGLGLMLGIGQDWSVDPRWSVGLLARVVGVESSSPGEHELTLLPSLNIAFTNY
jgi:hypothetical protein